MESTHTIYLVTEYAPNGEIFGKLHTEYNVKTCIDFINYPRNGIVGV